MVVFLELLRLKQDCTDITLNISEAHINKVEINSQTQANGSGFFRHHAAMVILMTKFRKSKWAILTKENSYLLLSSTAASLLSAKMPNIVTLWWVLLIKGRTFIF